jgi:hypothetical protein
MQRVAFRVEKSGAVSGDHINHCRYISTILCIPFASGAAAAVDSIPNYICNVLH